MNINKPLFLFSFFRFAQYLNLTEENTVIKGSPLYMAPEILLKHCYNPSADLWSIGVILYECIFGHAPYSSKGLDELLQKIKVKQKIVIVPSVRISMDCRDIMTRLLIHDPEQRITFQEFFEHPFLDLKHDATDEVRTLTCNNFFFKDFLMFLFVLFGTEFSESHSNCYESRRGR